MRERALRELDHVDLDAPNPLLRKGFVYGLVLQHELQHQESMLQTLALRTDSAYPVRDPRPADRAPEGPDEVEVAGGSFILGATDEPWAYDNELVPHEVELRPFLIDRAPVTNGDFANFVDAGGYGAEVLERRRAGSGASARTRRRRFTGSAAATAGSESGSATAEPLPPDEPVQHVSCYEAEALRALGGQAAADRGSSGSARRPGTSAGARAATRGGASTWATRRTSATALLPAPAGSYAGGESPTGCVQLAGDVWEWTSSYFQPYPGFLSFPYPEYSEVFFGRTYRVLRGGSWATDPLVAAGASGTGSTRTGATSSPASAARETPSPQACRAGHDFAAAAQPAVPPAT